MINEKKVTGIILVAGNSTRFGTGKDKNLEMINGKTVFSYSLNAFDENKYIDDIIIAINETNLRKIERIVETENISKNFKLVIGGDSRKNSVLNCIKATNSDIVIIHDGARPMIKQEYINKCIESMKDISGVTIGVKSKDTIKVTDDNNIVIDTTKRSNTWIIQTPQCFDRNILLKMHNIYKNEDVTDDCMLLEKGKYKVKIIEGGYTNIKITTYEDIDILRNLLK